jgi:exosortase H (IPTLxxWG-CTERM-specific)
LSGDTLLAPDSGFSMKIMPGCDGMNVIMLLSAALLAWPGAWKVKFKGIVFGALIVESANILRLITLFYLGQWNATWFEWMHVYVGEIVIMILGLGFFAFWIHQTPVPATADPAK